MLVLVTVTSESTYKMTYYKVLHWELYIFQWQIHGKQELPQMFIHNMFS